MLVCLYNKYCVYGVYSRIGLGGWTLIFYDPEEGDQLLIIQLTLVEINKFKLNKTKPIKPIKK